MFHRPPRGYAVESLPTAIGSKLSTPAKPHAKRVAFTASHADGGATVASLAPATVCASAADRVC
jgi:hypothetical protein